LPKARRTLSRYIRDFPNDPQYRDSLYAWMQRQQQSEADATLKERSVRNFSSGAAGNANQGIYMMRCWVSCRSGLTVYYDRH